MSPSDKTAFLGNSHYIRGQLAMVRETLLEYCGQDTLGLARLLEKMRAMEAGDAKR